MVPFLTLLLFWGRLLTATDFAALKSWIEQTNPTSMDQLVTELVQKPKGIASNFVLLHTSRSLDARAVSPQYPRVILYGGNLMLSFTGNPEKEHFHRAEMIEWVPSEVRFRFHRLYLKPNTVPFFESDPPNCITCHDKKSPRPLWGAHPLYPEAYGSFADKFLSLGEELAYEEHRKDLAPNSRYFPFPLRKNSNLVFLTYLNSLNDRRITLELDAWPEFTSYAPALRAIAKSCPKIETFLPAPVLEKHLATLESTLGAVPEGETPIEWLEQLTKQISEKDWKRRIDYYGLTFPLASSPPIPDLQREYRKVAETRLILEGRGYQMKTWSMNHAPGGFAHTYDLFDGTEGITRVLKRALPDQGDSCEMLKAKSIAALSSPRKTRKH